MGKEKEELGNYLIENLPYNKKTYSFICRNGKRLLHAGSTLAGFSTAMRIEAICIVSLAGIGNAVSSYTAQNIGAHKQDRVVEGYHEAHKMILVYALLICLVLETLHRPIIALFLGAGGTAVAVSAGQDYLMFMGWFFYLIGFKMAVDGLLRGAGDMKMFTIANLANLFIRVLLAVTLAPRFGIAMIWYAAPIGWSINWIISFVQYRTEKWKHVNICIL